MIISSSYGSRATHMVEEPNVSNVRFFRSNEFFKDLSSLYGAFRSCSINDCGLINSHAILGNSRHGERRSAAAISARQVTRSRYELSGPGHSTNTGETDTSTPNS